MTNSSAIQKKLGLDSIIVTFAILYILLPISIFFFGWLSWYIALPLNLVFLYFAKSIYLELSQNKISLIKKENLVFWLFVICVCVLWVYFSGIGGLSYQNSDHIFRNAIYRDLCNYEWPVIYDLSKEPQHVQAIIGMEKTSLTYYFAWWLPAALVSKIFSFGDLASFNVLYVWACFGIFLTIYLVVRYVKKCSYIIPLIIVFFSGLDVIPFFIQNNMFPTIQHIEWWAWFFQYSSNTTLLYWVFNQAIPIWLIVSIMVHLKDSRCIIGLISLSIAYSAWAVFGFVPFGIYILCKNFKRSLSFNNIALPIIMLLVFGTFYLASNSENTSFHSIFENEKPNSEIIISYIEFIFIEFLIYFILIGKKAFSYRFYWITLLELLLFPLCYIRTLDFVLRGTIPALFLLMLYITKSLSECNLSKVRKSFVLIALIIGMVTPYTEINRSVSSTNLFTSNIDNTIYSLGNVRSKRELDIYIVKANFMNTDLDHKFFYRCLAKKSYRYRYR